MQNNFKKSGVKKTYQAFFIILIILFALTGCENVNVDTNISFDTFDSEDLQTNPDIDILLSEDSISTTNSSVTIDGTTAIISNGGEYSISGILNNGQIIVNAPDEDVNLLLDNVWINNSTGPAIYVIEAQDVLLTLEEGSQNMLSDGKDYIDLDLKDDEPNATIFSMSDLDIVGSEGAILQISGKYKDAIATKDDLEILNLELEINAVDDGLWGKDSVRINGSTVTINAGGDAIKSDNDAEDKGFIALTDSEIIINAGDDAIRAVNLVEIFSGKIDIQDSFEGIEGKVITFYDGEVNLISRDDGINVSDSSAGLKGGEVLPGAFVNILGGNITLNTGGDGFDSNGSAVMEGGTLVVNGPTENRNGYIDVNGTFDITGGTLVAVGSAGMSETPDETSSQSVIQVTFDETQVVGTSLSFANSSGQEIFSFVPEKTFQSITYSSADLLQGKTYSILVNGVVYTTLTLENVITKYGESVQTAKVKKK